MWSSSQASCFLLGEDLALERATAQHLGGPSARFFSLAQRCIWGLCQPDLVKIDVPRALRQLEREYPATFVTHLIAAFATRKEQAARAEQALARARELCTREHPWRYLLPSHAEWCGEGTSQRLVEVSPERMWRVAREFPLSNTSFKVASIATLVRGEDGRLVFINPVALEAGVLRQVRALGPMSALALQGRGHSRYAEQARAQFPEARVLGTPGHLIHPASAHVRFDGLLGTPSGALPEEFVLFPVEGTQADEIVILHEPTGTLIAQDLLANNLQSNSARSFGGRLYYFAWGMCDRIGMHAYQLLLWQDLARLQRCLRAIAHADYARVTAAHWPLSPCAGSELEQFREQLRRLASLSPLRHRVLQARFVRHQPGFLIDLLRYGAKQRRAQAR